jgi:hypothetical protein
MVMIGLHTLRERETPIAGLCQIAQSQRFRYMVQHVGKQLGRKRPRHFKPIEIRSHQSRDAITRVAFIVSDFRWQRDVERTRRRRAAAATREHRDDS